MRLLLVHVGVFSFFVGACSSLVFVSVLRMLSLGLAVSCFWFAGLKATLGVHQMAILVLFTPALSLYSSERLMALPAFWNPE